MIVSKLYRWCRYVARTDRGYREEILVGSDYNRNIENKVLDVCDNSDNLNINFRNTRDFWNKNQSLSSKDYIIKNDHKSKYEKSKTFDEQTLAKHQIKDLILINNNQELKTNIFTRQNLYGKLKHRTVFDYTHAEETFDDELVSSDVDSLISKVNMKE